MSLAFSIPRTHIDPVKSDKVDTDKAYTLFIDGVATLNWNDLEYLQNALVTVPPTRSTYIQYNKEGNSEYEVTHE